MQHNLSGPPQPRPKQPAHAGCTHSAAPLPARQQRCLSLTTKPTRAETEISAASAAAAARASNLLVWGAPAALRARQQPRVVLRACLGSYGTPWGGGGRRLTTASDCGESHVFRIKAKAKGFKRVHAIRFPVPRAYGTGGLEDDLQAL